MASYEQKARELGQAAYVAEMILEDPAPLPGDVAETVRRLIADLRDSSRVEGRFSDSLATLANSLETRLQNMEVIT